MLPLEVSGGSVSAADRASDELEAEASSVEELRLKTNHSLLLLTKMRKNDLEKVGGESISLVRSSLSRRVSCSLVYS